MNKIATCEFSIFDEVFGEYKCELKCQRLRNIKVCEKCEMYKKRKKGEEQKVSKNEYDNNER